MFQSPKTNQLAADILELISESETSMDEDLGALLCITGLVQDQLRGSPSRTRALCTIEGGNNLQVTVTVDLWVRGEAS